MKIETNSTLVPAHFSQQSNLQKLGHLRVAKFLDAFAPENNARLDALIQRHIPNVSVPQTSTLNRALELWFHVPEALDEFTTINPPAPVPSVPLVPSVPSAPAELPTA